MRRRALPLVLLLAPLAASCLSNQGGGPAVPNVPSIFSVASPNADAIARFTWLLHAAMTAVFLGILAALLTIAWRYRARSETQRGRQIYGNTRLEVAWTATPAVILAAVFTMSLNVMCNVDPAVGADDATVQDGLRVVVTGRQWWWEYAIPEVGVVTANELHLPVGRAAQLELHGGDVIHNWWVPALHGKLDTVPGRSNVLTFTPTQEGVFGGACAEFCGPQHAWMRLRVVVESPEAFAGWAAAQTAPAPALTTPAAQRGQQLFTQATCASCHSIGGASQATANAGPNLTNLASRATLAAGVIENNPENLAAWLRDPQQIKPGNLMPTLRLSEDDVQALTAYLLVQR
jgi:cytochrome c oxidase subunit 2